MPDGSPECMQDYGATKQRLSAVESRLDDISEQLSDLNSKIQSAAMTHAKDETKHQVERGLALWIGRGLLTLLFGLIVWLGEHVFQWAIAPGGPLNRN